MKYPFVMIALCYGGGILLADFLPLPLGWLFVAAFALVLPSTLWPRGRPWLIWPSLALVGMTALRLHQSALSPADLRTVVGETMRYTTVRGVLRETPYLRVYEHGDEQTWRTIALLEARSLQTQETNWTTVQGDVVVSTAGVLPPEFFGGRAVEITGILRVPKGPLAQGLFDYRRHLSRLGVHYQLQVESTNEWRVAGGSVTPSVADRFRAWAQATLARGLPEEDESLRLLWAMTLGWKTALTDEVSEPFMRSGTMHIFAISGLHIALIAGLLVSLFRVLTVPRGKCGLLVIPLIWFYTGVTGWQASAIRSTIMMTVIIAGWSLRRPSELLNSLGAAAWIILVWDPSQLFQASFQLSFSVVLSLGLFLPALDRIRKRWMAPDPFLPDALRPRWRRWMERPAHHLTASFTTSLAAWLGSMPLVASYFHLFTPVSLLANLMIVPLSGLALTSNLASLATGGWWSGGAELFNHSAWFWMHLMVRLSAWCAELPGAAWNITAPGPLTFLLYYSLLLSLMSGWWLAPRWRRGTLAGLGLLTLLWTAGWLQDRSRTRLHILPLNGGTAIYLEAPGQDDWLIDCGNQSSAEFVTRPFLKSRGVNHLDHLLLTHGDLRHFGGAAFIQEKFRARQVLFSPVRTHSSAYQQLRTQLEAIPGLTRSVQRGDRLGPWTVLHPAADTHFPQADDNAVVLLGEFQGTRVLLLSDLGKPGQNALLQHHPGLRADIVVAGLPHQSEPLADALIETLQPRLIVFPDADYPSTERAGPKLRQRLERHHVRVLYGRDTGSVTLTFRGREWEVQTLRPPPPPPSLTPDASAAPTQTEPEG